MAEHVDFLITASSTGAKPEEASNTRRPQFMHDAKPYGVAIQQAVASGDLAKMKAAAAAAEHHLAQYGNVSAALEALKIEIAKLEKK